MQLMEPVSKEEYLEWKSNRVTKQFLQDLYNKREMLKEGVVELQDSNESARLVTIGRCQAMKDTMDWALRDFEYEGKYKDDVESNSPQDYS